MNSFMNQHRSILLIICVLVVSNLLTSLYSQNHNPAFTVSNLHIDGSDYVIIPPDADATPVRTGVTMTYRDNDGDGNPDIPTEGSTALGWEREMKLMFSRVVQSWTCLLIVGAAQIKVKRILGWRQL